MAEILDHRPAVAWSTLEARLRGPLIHSGDERLLMIGKQLAAGTPPPWPRVLIACADADDVRRSVDFLGLHQQPFAVRGGGNCFADKSSHPTVVLDLSALDAIEIGRDRVRVGSGAACGDLGHALAQAGLTVPLGNCAHVSIGGLSLSGGFGFLGRQLGLTLDWVEQLEVVTADGNFVKASAHQHSELFWALLGAGAAGFGIVTALTLRVAPLNTVTVCHGQWPLNEAAGLVERWQLWAPTCDGRINIGLRVLAPEDPRHSPSIELSGVVLDTGFSSAGLAELRRHLLGPLARDLSIWRLCDRNAADYLVGLLDQRTEKAWQPCRPIREPAFHFTRCDFFEDGLSADAIHQCLAHLNDERRFPQVREIEFTPWGGAYARENAGACFLHRRPRMLVRHTAVVGARSTQDLRDNARQWADRSQAALIQHASSHSYQGYADPQRADWAHAYFGGTYPQLQAIKHRHDPRQLFGHLQAVVPAA